MLECTVTVSCRKTASYRCDIDITKVNELRFVVTSESVDELKSYSKEISVAAIESLDSVIEKTEFDTKAELSAMKEAWSN